MQTNHLLLASERKAALRRAISRRAPGISQDQLNFICNSVNTKRRYFIKQTECRQRFLNLTTRETIVTEDVRVFSEVLPLYGSFQPPYFEKVGEKRQSREGALDITIPAAAVKIRAGMEHQRPCTTYTLILFLTQQNP